MKRSVVVPLLAVGLAAACARDGGSPELPAPTPAITTETTLVPQTAPAPPVESLDDPTVPQAQIVETTETTLVPQTTPAPAVESLGTIAVRPR